MPADADAVAELDRRLERLELHTDAETLNRYGRDEGPFRRVPAAVLRARDAEQVAAAVEAAAAVGLTVTARAGGSGVAGGALGEGLVIDTSRLDEIDPDGESVWCAAGAVLDAVNERLASEGREIGPDVISSRSARVGGLIATNACGSRSLIHGRFAGALLEAEVVLAEGSRVRLAPGEAPGELSEAVAVAAADLAGELGGWPDIPRDPGGYRLPELANTEEPISVVAGSEGTLCVITRARLRTVPVAERRTICVAAFKQLSDALEAAPELGATGASAVELLDGHLTSSARSIGLGVLPPDAGATLIVEHRDDDAARGPELVAKAASGALIVDALDERDAALAWSLRTRALEEAGGDLQPLACFEDPAVDPADVAGFCDALLEVLRRFRFEGLIYGHAAAGCLHVRPLCDTADTNLAARILEAAEAVGDAVGEWGGSITGEHGWGLSRSHLARRALGDRIYARMEAVKRAFDPGDVLNPGIVVGGEDPRALFDPVPPSRAASSASRPGAAT